MARDYWFISDTHFFHANMMKFKNDDGTPVRMFKSVEEMNETMVQNWNAVVKDGDYVYHLGDVTFDYSNKFRELMWRLKGHKRLIVGNHDKLKEPYFMDQFQKAMFWHGFKEHNFTASHMPGRLDGLRDGIVNVHGHIHNKHMTDPHYINVSVEVINYTPVNLDWIKAEIKERNL